MARIPQEILEIDFGGTMITTTFPVTIKIRKNETGEIREYHTDEYLHNGEWSDYMWCTGNYSCDCNRELFFEEADTNNNSEIDIEGIKCSEGRYTILEIKRDSDSEIIYREE